MKRVMAVGVFDLIHTGHLHYLQEARRLGDELVVVVASDRSVATRKHHPPILPQAMRAELVAALKPVDRVVLGRDADHLKTAEEVRPDVIALGHDDYHNEAELKAELARRGMDCAIVRIAQVDHDLGGTRKILRRIFDLGFSQKFLDEFEARQRLSDAKK
ncbi:MAG: adenylyltransferase/cytidyltransferase family protein [Methanobacteriota archaeon]